MQQSNQGCLGFCQMNQNKESHYKCINIYPTDYPQFIAKRIPTHDDDLQCLPGIWLFTPPYPIQSPLSWALCRLTTLLFLNPLTEISRRMTRNVLNVKQFVLWHKWVMSRTTATHTHTAYPRVNPAAVEPGEVEWQKYHQHFHPPPIYSQLSGLSGANEDEDEAGRQAVVGAKALTDWLTSRVPKFR